MKIVMVIWDDAQSGTQDWTDIDNADQELAPVITIGQEISKSDECITVALSSSGDEVRNTITIPMACVESIFTMDSPLEPEPEEDPA